METAAGLIKLKPESKQSVEEWSSTIDARRDEALQTLHDEGVVVESWFQLELDGADYLLWYMRAKSIERAWEVAAQSDHQIDKYHFKTLSKIAEAQIPTVPILDLSTSRKAR